MNSSTLNFDHDLIYFSSGTADDKSENLVFYAPCYPGFNLELSVENSDRVVTPESVEEVTFGESPFKNLDTDIKLNFSKCSFNRAVNFARNNIEIGLVKLSSISGYPCSVSNLTDVTCVKVYFADQKNEELTDQHLIKDKVKLLITCTGMRTPFKIDYNFNGKLKEISFFYNLHLNHYFPILDYKDVEVINIELPALPEVYSNLLLRQITVVKRVSKLRELILSASRCNIEFIKDFHFINNFLELGVKLTIHLFDIMVSLIKVGNTVEVEFSKSPLKIIPYLGSYVKEATERTLEFLEYYDVEYSKLVYVTREKPITQPREVNGKTISEEEIAYFYSETSLACQYAVSSGLIDEIVIEPRFEGSSKLIIKVNRK